MSQEYLAALVDLLSKYSEPTLAETLHPTTGFPVKHKFLPALSEFKEALDNTVASKYAAVQKERLIRSQLDERALEEKIREDRKTRPTYEELMKGVPDRLRLRPSLPKMTAEEFLANHPHVTKEMLDAVPDAPKGSQALSEISVKPEQEPNPFE